jgi:RNase P protein component
MLPKKNRISKKDVDMLFRHSSFLNSPHLNFKFTLGNKSAIPQISFIAPKSVSKLAVKRNALRRKGYVVLENYISQFPAGILGVFLFKKYQDDASIIENEIKNILSKIN